MTNWENVKTESIANINDIALVSQLKLFLFLLVHLIKLLHHYQQCQFNLDNYKLACSNLGDDQDSDIVTKAQTFIDS